MVSSWMTCNSSIGISDVQTSEPGGYAGLTECQ